MRIQLVVGFVIASTNVAAETWHCRNETFEITCTGNDCRVQQEYDFTPMEIFFNDQGDLIVCAYSGCWEGSGEVTRSERFIAIFAADLAYSTDPEPGRMRQDIALLVDRQDNVTLLKSGHFAQPFACALQKKNDEA